MARKSKESMEPKAEKKVKPVEEPTTPAEPAVPTGPREPWLYIEDAVLVEKAFGHLRQACMERLEPGHKTRWTNDPAGRIKLAAAVWMAAWDAALSEAVRSRVIKGNSHVTAQELLVVSNDAMSKVLSDLKPKIKSAYKHLKDAHYAEYETGHPLNSHDSFNSCKCDLAKTARDLLSMVDSKN